MQPYDNEIEETMRRYYNSLSEKDRRRYAGLEALKFGHGGRSALGSSVAVDEILEFLPGLEVRNALLGNLDAVTGLGVAPLPRTPASNAEAPEASQFDLVLSS